MMVLILSLSERLVVMEVALRRNITNFLDQQSPTGLSYYRLKQTDFNGAFTYSNTIRIKREEGRFGFNSISPVPAVNYVEVSFNLESEAKTHIQIHNLTGKTIAAYELNGIKGTNTLELDVEVFSAGIYLISIHNGESVKTGKFIKN